MTIKKISAENLLEKMEERKNILLLDVRAKEKYHDFNIQNEGIEGLNIPKANTFNLEDNEDTVPLPKDKEIIITCSTGNSATKCAQILPARGHNVQVLD